MGAPKDFTGSKFFKSLSDNVAFYTISFKSLSEDQRTKKEAIIDLPLFSNTEKETCPLTYSISSDNKSIVKVKDIKEKFEKDKI